MQANFRNIVALWFPSQSHLKQKQRVITERNLLCNGELVQGLTALTATKLHLILKLSGCNFLLQKTLFSHLHAFPVVEQNPGYTWKIPAKGQNNSIWWPQWVTPCAQTGRPWMLGTRNINLWTNLIFFITQKAISVSRPPPSPKKTPKLMDVQYFFIQWCFSPQELIAKKALSN